MSNSQNSVAGQLDSLRKEAEILEQKVSHKNAELQAAQRKLSSLSDEYASQTEKLVHKQRKTLTSEAIPLRAEIDSLEVTIKKAENSLSDIKNDLDVTNAEFLERTIKLADINVEISMTLKRLSDVEEEYESLCASSESLTTQNAALMTANADLIENNRVSQEALIALQEKVSALESKIISYNTEYDDKITDKEYQLHILDAKLLEKANQASEINNNDMKTRQDLAVRAKLLDEKDKNIRVREQKVQQGEEKLIRNSNLMDL